MSREMFQHAGIRVGGSFDFVHLSQDQPKQSEETRYAVRSNAIKHYWRHRQIGQGESQQQTQSTARARRDLSKPGDRQKKANVKSVAAKQQQHAFRQQSNRIAAGTAACVATPESVRASSESDCNTDIECSDELRNAHAGSRAKGAVAQLENLQSRTSPMLMRPSLWGRRQADGAESPAQTDLMLGICRHWFSWLINDSTSGTVNARNEFAQRTGSDPMLLAANCLAAVGCRRAVEPALSSGLELALKATVLRRLRQRLDTGRNDAGAFEIERTIMMLVTFEMTRSSQEAEEHLQGLLAIMRAQHRRDKSKVIDQVFESAYLLPPIFLDSQPIRTQLPSWYAQELQSPPQDAHDIDDNTELCASPLESFSRLLLALTRQQQSETPFPTSPNPVLAQLISSLRDFADDMQLFASSSIPADDRIMKRQVEIQMQRLKALQQISQQSHPLNGSHAQSDAADTDSLLLTLATYITLSILCNVVVEGHNFDSSANQALGSKLVSIFRRGAPPESWNEVPFLIGWIFLVGASACRDRESRSFFFAQLPRHNMRVMLSQGASAWEKTRAITLEFARLKASVERRRKSYES